MGKLRNMCAMRIAMTILTVSLALSAACKKKTEGGDNTGSAAGSADMGSATMGSATGSGSAMAGSAGSGSDMGSGAAGSAAMGSGSDTGSAAMAGSGSGDAMAAAMAHHAGNCPSTVLGSTTKVELKDTAVVVTITSDDKDAVRAIQTRTEALLKGKQDKKDGAMGAVHDQKGSHGGAQGICPVFLGEGSKAVQKHDKKGVTVMITPKDKAAAAALKTEIDARIVKSADWVKANVKEGDKGNTGGVGGGSGDDGMNHSGKGDAKGIERKKAGTGGGSGAGTGGGSGKGTGGGKTK